MRRLVLALIAAMTGMAYADQPVPTAITAERALNLALQMKSFKFDGQLRVDGKAKVSYPVSVVTTGWFIIYNFPTAKLKILAQLGPDQKCVQIVEAGKPVRVLTPEEYTGKVLKSDITYEDLCLAFTLWVPSGEIRKDNIKTLPAWAFDVRPSGPSNYASVRLWMSSDFYGLLRVDGLNERGQTIKRVEINNVSRLKDTYLLKELMVSTVEPGRDLAISRTYLDASNYQSLEP